jgi:hypothetical protein
MACLVATQKCFLSILDMLHYASVAHFCFKALSIWNAIILFSPIFGIIFLCCSAAIMSAAHVLLLKGIVFGM